MSRTEGARRVAQVSRAWSECALHVRGQLRAYGVRGELRRLDDYTSGNRGAGMARFIAEFVAYCHEKGMPPDAIAQRLGTFTADAVAHVTKSA